MSDIRNHIDMNLAEDIEKDMERSKISDYEYYDLIIKLRTMAYHKRIFEELYTLADVYCQEKSYQHHEGRQK